MAKRLLPVKELLRAVLRNEARPQEFNGFVNLCISIALTLLERKAASGQLSRVMFQIPLKDLAVDCVADLFRIDEDGVPIQMQTYFECVNLSEASEEETLILLRRLIFSKVRQGLFRSYNEHDPSLGRILRNIKLGVNLTGEFAESERFGDTVLTPTRCEALTSKPAIQRETLSQMLGEIQLANDHVPSMLSALSLHLRNQTTYSRIIPLIPLALAWREHLISNRVTEDATFSMADTGLLTQDVRRIAQEACDAVKEVMRPRYVKVDGIDEVTLDAYFRAIAASVFAEYWDAKNSESLFTLLKAEIPRLTEQEYRANHRNALEYLLKLVRKRTRAELTKAFD